MGSNGQVGVDSAGVPGGGMIQLLPHRHGVDGFFLALLERKAA